MEKSKIAAEAKREELISEDYHFITFDPNTAVSSLFKSRPEDPDSLSISEEGALKMIMTSLDFGESKFVKK